jgi:transcriptional regulator with XRE-family HTH domain
VDNIGQRLKEERQLRGWSQRDLARETGVNTDTISGIETGQHEPRPSTLRKLAEGLGVEVRDLFIEPALGKAEAPRGAGPQTVKGSAALQGEGELEATGEVIKKIRQIADELDGGKRSREEAAEELEEQARKLRKPAA